MDLMPALAVQIKSITKPMQIPIPPQRQCTGGANLRAAAVDGGKLTGELTGACGARRFPPGARNCWFFKFFHFVILTPRRPCRAVMPGVTPVAEEASLAEARSTRQMKRLDVSSYVLHRRLTLGGLRASEAS